MAGPVQRTPPDAHTLARLIRANDADALADALVGLDDAARRALADTAWRFYRAAIQGKPLPLEAAADAPAITRVSVAVQNAMSPDTQLRNMRVAALPVLACCRLDRVRRIQFYDVHQGGDAILRVLRDRRPDWIDDWLAHCLDARDFPLLDWTLTRRLMAEGLVAPPTCDGYVRLMALQMQRWRKGREPYVPVGEQLRAHPDVLTGPLWRVFEVDTAAFAFDWRARTEGLPPDYEAWPEALARLARDGTLDRTRMLDACLAAPWKFESTTAQTNVCRLYAELAPSLDESAARAERYLELLRHRHGAVVGHALAWLGALQRQGRLTIGTLLPRLAPVFDLKAKRHALAALKLLVPVDAALASNAEALFDVLGIALLHPARDVQAAAITVLERCRPTHPDTVRALLERSGADLAPSLRSAIDVPPRGDDEDEGAVHDAGADVGAQDDEARQASGAPVAPAGPRNVLDTRPCASAQPLAPLAELQAVIDHAARLLERVEGAGDVERLLDGISRFCAERPPDFALRTAALATRLTTRDTGQFNHGLRGFGTPPEFASLLALWLGTSTTLLDFAHLRWMRWHGSARALRARLRELADRVARREAAPLLATPTHEGGWVHAPVLVARLQALQHDGVAVPEHDFALALYRLAPDDRTQARSAAASIDGDAGRVLRFALGDDALPRASDRARAPWWVAAAHARAPVDDRASLLTALALPEDWPGLTAPARCDWSVIEREERSHARAPPRHVARLDLRWSPPLPDNRMPPPPQYVWYGGWRGLARRLRDGATALARGLQRTALRAHDARRSGQALGIDAFTCVAQHARAGMAQGWCIDLLGWTTPLLLAPHFAEGARELLNGIDHDGSGPDPGTAWLLPLLADATPWSEAARLVLALALVSRAAQRRGLAVEAAIRAVDDGRASAAPLADTLARLAGTAVFKHNRLAAAFTDAARAGPAHARFVVTCIEAFLLCRGAVGHDDLPLLELLRELHADAGSRVHDTLLPLLSAVAGQGKTARTARALVEAHGTGPRASGPAP